MRRHGVILTLAALLLLASQPTPATRCQDARRLASSRWGADYFPNVPLVTHEGKTVRFFDDLIKDKVVAINFIYTSCPDVCPLETARLAEVQRILGDRVGHDVFLYSITIDPARDTPEVLERYAEKYQVGPGWLFLTGKEEDITLLRKKLGLYIPEIQEIREDGTRDHNLSLIIGNQATGRWMKRSPFENPYVLADQIGSWLHNWKLPSKEEKDYADAPELRTLSRGESLFRTRCAACHDIGASHSEGQPEPRIGPDLLGVTRRRDRAWLARWLADPEKMLAEEDPIAIALYEKHRQVAMPDMSLNEVEVTALIDYLDAETRRLEETASAAAAVEPDGASGDPKACCQKSQSLVLDSAPDRGKSTEPPKGVRRFPIASVILLAVGGLGVVLGLAAAVFRRHSSA